jgi:hypothetical protein
MKLVNTKLRIESIARDFEEYGIAINSSKTSESIVEDNKNRGINIWVGTQAEYDNISSKDNLTMYLVTA